MLEIVHLRSSGEPLAVLAGRIRESLGTADENTEITLYRRYGLETDLAVHIHHRGLPRGKEPSGLALQLASALRGFGLVEHTQWEDLR